MALLNLTIPRCFSCYYSFNFWGRLMMHYDTKALGRNCIDKNGIKWCKIDATNYRRQNSYEPATCLPYTGNIKPLTTGQRSWRMFSWKIATPSIAIINVSTSLYPHLNLILLASAAKPNNCWPINRVRTGGTGRARVKYHSLCCVGVRCTYQPATIIMIKKYLFLEFSHLPPTLSNRYGRCTWW